jgi:hypothetical protein
MVESVPVESVDVIAEDMTRMVFVVIVEPISVEKPRPPVVIVDPTESVDPMVIAFAERVEVTEVVETERDCAVIASETCKGPDTRREEVTCKVLPT